MIDFNQCSLIMGIVNVTPDSFSGDGVYKDTSKLLDQVSRFLEDGADIIDVGGESTRPGAQEVEEDEEYSRVIPALEAILGKFPDISLSVDTSKPKIMQAAVGLGVSLINDVRSLSKPGALEAVSNSDVNVVINHMQGQPDNMQSDPTYENVINEVFEYFSKKISEYEAAGINKDRILLDPGFGFGKNLTHNYSLLHRLSEFKTLGCPLLVGVSRKRMIKDVVGLNQESILVGSITANLLAMQAGANVLRVHDVAHMRAALNIVNQTEVCYDA